MNEGIPNQPGKENSDIMQVLELAIDICESREIFPFPGITRVSYSRIKADEEEMPGFSTPIDQLLRRFESEGMKVVLGKNPASGNVYILPAGSDDIENDSLFPRHLNLDRVTNDKLRRLINLQTKKQ